MAREELTKARHQSGFVLDLTLLHTPTGTTVALTGMGCPVGNVIGGRMMLCVVIRQVVHSLVPIKTKLTLCGRGIVASVDASKSS